MNTNSKQYADWFTSRVSDLVASNSGSPAILAFMGMSPYQANLLSAIEGAVPGIVTSAAKGSHYSPAAFQEQKRAILATCLTASTPIVMLYEQLLELKGTISEMFPGRVVIVRNNLFLPSEGYPSPVSEEDLAAFVDAIDNTNASPSPLSKYYVDAQPCGSSYLITPIWIGADEDWGTLDLYEETSDYPSQPIASSAEPMASDGPLFLEYRLTLSCGYIAAASIKLLTKKGGKTSSGSACAAALAAVASEANLPVSFQLASEDEEKVGDTGALLPLLRQYWGEKAEFRFLSFYSNPDFTNEMERVSQGAICEFVVQQAMAARDGVGDYKNVLLTAPTGAGKSILFQIPALYLAQKLKTVTLVIEPLKALMNDQVVNLKNRGVEDVVAINSDISYEKRLDAYERIRDGRASIIYLSPELLLESSLDSILNGRDLGLVVVDEVHTVTSWGKDFRPDYWYLGPYLSKLRKTGTYQFPIFCLTATAVYGGRDDAVNQTISDLELGDCKLFLGNPRRKNIRFDIQWRSKSEFPGPIESVKMELTNSWIDQTVASNKHAIVYCPYRSQVDAVSQARSNDGSKVLFYHGGMDKEYKKIVEKSFKGGSCRVLVSTKAFGMGVDIDDIESVYHYAPTGNLSDYIQEIGRGGRKSGLTATATIDFFTQDTRYAEQLYALSRFSQWQLREMMNKLYEVYVSRPKEIRSQNFLVSPNSFSYLFANEKSKNRQVNKVKSGLMMIARDLEDRFNFPVIVVRPKMNYTKQFVCIDETTGQGFIEKYGKYLNKVSNGHKRTEERQGQNRVTISDSGLIYELYMGDMWSEKFADLTFANFKRMLFSGEICGDSKGAPVVSNRMALEISYAKPYEDVVQDMATFCEALNSALTALLHKGDFRAKDFEAELSERLKGTSVEVGKYRALLNALVRPVDTRKRPESTLVFKCVKSMNRSQEKTIRPSEPTYNVIGREVAAIASKINQALSKLRPPEGASLCRRYLDCESLGARYALAELLEILQFATYTVKGGDNPEIFIRLNDPVKIHGLAADKSYSNKVLRELNDKHAYSSKVIKGFFRTKMDDSARWDLIEEYFLGNDAYVAEVLGIENEAEDGEAKPKVRHRETASGRYGLVTSFVNEGVSTEGAPLFRVWKEIINECQTSDELHDAERLKGLTRGACFETPFKHPVLKVESTGLELHPLLAWKEKQVLLFSSSNADEYAKAQGINWKCYMLGQGESISELAKDIKLKSSEDN